MSIDKIINLTKAKSSSVGFVGHCPSHNDKNPSFWFNDNGDSPPSLKCYSCCTKEEIEASLREQGCWSWDDGQKKPFLDNALYAKKAWDEATPLTGTCLASTYLAKRGLHINDFASLTEFRFHSALYKKNSETGEIGYIPALICRIQNHGRLVGIQRIWLTGNANKIKPPQVLGSKGQGGYIQIGDDSNADEIHLAEGPETGLAIFLALGKPVYCLVDAGNLSLYEPSKTIKTVHQWADKDLSKTGEKEARKLMEKLEMKGIKSVLHLPSTELPDGKKSQDFLDEYNLDPVRIQSELGLGETGTYQPQPIMAQNYDLPAMEEFSLPFILRDWTQAHASRLNIVPEMIAVSIISVVGSLIGRRLVMRLKKYDNWEITPNLWAAIVAAPGMKKSPALKPAMDLLRSIDRETQIKIDCEAAANAASMIMIEQRIASLKKKLKKAADAEDSGEQDLLAKAIIKAQSDQDSMKIVRRTFETNASSYEKLIDLLAANPYGFLYFRDELSGLIESFKKKGNENLRQFFLEAWDGNGKFRYDTLQRGTVSVEGVCLTLLGGIQPAVIKQQLIQSKAGYEDGFLQRFQLLIYLNPKSDNRFTDNKSPIELDERVQELLRFVADIDSEKHGSTDASGKIPFVRLDDEAYELFKSYYDSLERSLPGIENTSYRSHLSKYGKLMGGLILIFHVIDNFETGKFNREAKVHTVEMAIKWAELLKAHARKLYDIDYNLEVISGMALARKIASGKVKDGDSLRSIYQNRWSDLMTTDEVECAARYLERHRWLCLEETKSGALGGRPSTFLKFHTALPDFLKHERWNQ